MITEEDIVLNRTCFACPEQYDAVCNGHYAGYLRLRHGHFYVEDSDGNIVYEANPYGDGSFEENERKFHLRNAREAIAKVEEAKANIKIIVSVRDGVAYCDDPRVEIIDYDNLAEEGDNVST